MPPINHYTFTNNGHKVIIETYGDLVNAKEILKTLVINPNDWKI